MARGSPLISHTDPVPALWWARLDVPAGTARALADCLSADERARATRFVSARDAARFVAARAFLRRVLARYADISPAEVCFRYGPHGKPALDGSRDEVRFNLAHAGGLAACAVSCGPGEVGVDIEPVRPLRDLEGLARTAFSPGEVARLMSLPASARLRAFFEAWTRKEAFLKAVGCGLSRPLRSVEVAFGPGERARVLRIDADPDAAARFPLQAIELDRDVVGAVALEGGGIFPVPREWAWD